LSAAAAAGIGAGVAAGILAVACGVFVVWRKRRHSREGNDREHHQEKQGGWQEKKEPEILAHPYEYERKRTFLAELSSTHTPAEIG
jgi:flagellar biosynthesis/type III secretory pathway M-ring protein FliF/YscJ